MSALSSPSDMTRNQQHDGLLFCRRGDADKLVSKLYDGRLEPLHTKFHFFRGSLHCSISGKCLEFDDLTHTYTLFILSPVETALSTFSNAGRLQSVRDVIRTTSISVYIGTTRYVHCGKVAHIYRSLCLTNLQTCTPLLGRISAWNLGGIFRCGHFRKGPRPSFSSFPTARVVPIWG